MLLGDDANDNEESIELSHSLNVAFADTMHSSESDAANRIRAQTISAKAAQAATGKEFDNWQIWKISSAGGKRGTTCTHIYI